jgi:hypothetical protein
MTLDVVFDEKLPEEEEEETDTQTTTDEPQWSGQGGYYSGDMEDFFRQFFGFGY